ncbi:hypothetical protein PRUPE_7G183200 [Prunus persica]|uniref:DUF4378 domain-containing protein n=1 Tax=Prunus persica TaxID=3760 RepID=A0A251NDA5_PRUPE|nr:uncharacterized protein LOC18770239 [Prunus persica]ONH97309.1 hypothetical protein PRUPE_7G183200 [Prunus persica]ONH97310.1 hypothetical protein PRUPE_7G183200 [Prunus persica]
MGGGLLHLFDFNQGSMARKLFTHKKHDGGLEAPRNSLELQVEPQSYCDVGDLPIEENWSKKNYPLESSMKKLINEEISKHSSTRQNAPNIVARLMGMDMFPLDTKSAVQPIEEKSENRRMKSSKKETNGRSSAAHDPSNLKSSRQIDLDSYYHNNDRDATRWGDDQKIENPRRKEHPQEEELKKFKKEFEAWQAARFRECSRIVEVDRTPGRLLGREDLNKEKVALSGRTAIEKTVEPKDYALKTISHEGRVLQCRGDKTELFPAEHEGPFSSRSRRTMSLDFEQSSMTSKKRLDASSAPTRIVILKPGPDRLCNQEETWIGSSNTLEQRGGIEDFLEEVKERLKCELQGKMHKRGSVVRGSGVETPYSEQPSAPKKIARHIANQVRESVTRDLGMNLLRSESTKSYRSEIQFNGPGSPEFIHRDTRRIFLERLRSASKRETDLGVPVLVSGSSSLSAFDNDRARLKQVGDTLEAQKDMSCWERGIVKDEHEKTRSFRHGPHDKEVLDRELSPRNLIRSLSAPVPGTSFGKLLLEDRHVLTGAHIQRKHEGIDHMSMEMKHQKKERFNFKEKVSNFRYSFTLRGRLFGKKIQSIAESHCNHYPMKDIMSGPTVVMNSGERHENFTEVPPSPASVCSSAREDFWRPTDYLSPISTPATPREDNIVPRAFRDISDNLNELRRQLNQLESDEPEDIKDEQKVVETEMVGLEDPAEAYIRDLLVACGLYDGSFEKSLARWDTFSKPISNSVFEEVEESHKKLAKKDDSSANDHNEKVDHKVLRDLLNEALSTVLGPPRSMSKFRRKIIGSSVLPPLRGKKLLNCVWQIIHERLHPPTDGPYYSLDDMVSRDLGSSPWSGLIDDDVNALGGEMESLITEDLVQEILDDMQL